MDLRDVFSRGHPAVPAAGQTGAPSHAIETGLGAAIGAVLAGVAGGVLAGPVGTLCGMALGAALGAACGKRVAKYVDNTHEDAYWRERPYVDTGFGSRDLAVEHAPDPAQPTQPATLEDVAANPRAVNSRLFDRSGSGMPRSAIRTFGRPLSLSELAAQGK